MALAVPNIKRPISDSVAQPILAAVSVRERLSRGSVQWSPDAARVFALPRREKPDLLALVEELTVKLKRPGGEQRLRPIQAWVLWEGPQVGGLLGPIGVGAGKTLTGLLMPMVMPSCRKAVLFIPPSLRAQLLQRDWEFYGRHWNLPNLAGGDKFVPGRPVLHVVAYSELSSPKATTLLEQIDPDLIIGDEFHQLRHHTSARTKRFLRYLAGKPQTRVCGWSGTLTSKSLRDYAHLSAVALGEGSPLPVHQTAVEEWAAALDPGEMFFDSGVLKRLCNPGEDVRAGFRRRLVDTPGVVATAESALGTSLVFYERKVSAVPVEIQEHLRKLRRSPEAGGWVRPDGEELVDAMSVNACARQLACGFFYRWRFPRGESEELIREWFRLRQNWNRELREKLKTSRAHLDSPMLCANAARRFYAGGCGGCGRQVLEEHSASCSHAESHPLWPAVHWPAWQAIENQVYHVTEAVWVSDYVMADAVAWAKERPGIVWVEHSAVGEKLAQLSRLPYYGGGMLASEALIREDGSRSVVASAKAHSEGKNLQNAFSRNLVVSVPSDAKRIEQLIGRTHRSGQPADEVEVHLYRHTEELEDALEKAREKARYFEETMGNAQRLNYGTYAF